jgi:sugar lactone lactonase YvrE
MTRGIPAALAAAALLFAAPGLQAHPGTGIVVDAQGRVAFTNLKSVWRWEPGGRLTEIVPGVHTHALRLTADGTLVGEDLRYDAAHGRFVTAIWRLSPDGRLTRGPATDEAPFEFSPAVGPDGSIYFSRVDNNRRDVSEIYRLKPGGDRELVAGGAYGWADGVGKAARFGPVGALAVAPDGSILVSDAPAVRRIAPDGRVSTLARGTEPLKPSLASRLMGEHFGYLMGLAVDPAGNVLVANYGSGRVVKVTPAGGVSSVLASEGIWTPSGVALQNGDLYVLETAKILPIGFRVRKLSSRGQVTTLAVLR